MVDKMGSNNWINNNNNNMELYIVLDPPDEEKCSKRAHNYYPGHRINVHTDYHTQPPGDHTTQAARMNGAQG